MNTAKPVVVRTTPSDRSAGHLFASQPAHDRQVLPWLIAALVHVPVLYLFFTWSPGERVSQRTVILDGSLPENLEPPTIVPVLPSDAPKPTANTERERPTSRPLNPTTGLPNSNAITNHATVQAPRVESGRAAKGSPVARLAPPVEPGNLAPTNPAKPLAGLDAVRARISDRLAPFNDSVAAASRAAERASDWTLKDKANKRWGVSPGAIHLGDVTLKLAGATNGARVPDVFVPPPGRREEANARVLHWNEIEAQATRTELKARFDGRVKEIRQRMDGQRVTATADKPIEKKKPGASADVK